MLDSSALPVLVIGDDMRIFLSVVRSLGRAGLNVHALPLEPDAPALSSRYITRVEKAPAFEADPQGWRGALDQLMTSKDFDLVIPCAESAIVSLDARRQAYSRQILAIPSTSSMPLLFDKEQTHLMCDELDIPNVFWQPLDKLHTAESLVSLFGLPLVIKPRRSFWADSANAREIVEIVDDLPELERVLGSITDRGRYLVESYFEGSGTGVSVIAKNGTILQAFQHRRLREGRGGCSSYRISEAINQELRQAAEAVCAKIKHNGVCMFEFRVNKSTGKWVIIEINARFWGSIPLPLALGLDYPKWLYDLLVNDASRSETHYPVGVRSRNIPLDTNNLLKKWRRGKELNASSFLVELVNYITQPVRWATGQEKVDGFSLDDLRPSFKEISWIASSLMYKPEKGKLGPPGVPLSPAGVAPFSRSWGPL